MPTVNGELIQVEWDEGRHPSGFDWAASTAVRIRQNTDAGVRFCILDHRTHHLHHHPPVLQ